MAMTGGEQRTEARSEMVRLGARYLGSETDMATVVRCLGIATWRLEEAEARLDALEARHAADGGGAARSPGGADAPFLPPLGSLQASHDTHPRRDEEVGGPISYATHPLAEGRPRPDPWDQVRAEVAALRLRVETYPGHVPRADAAAMADRLDAAIRAARGEG